MTETRSPGTLADDAGVGTLAWTNPENAAASDDTQATAAGATVTTHYLKATNFGFTIPAGATINGVEVKIERKKSAGSAIVDGTVRLVKGGTIQGDNKASGSAWPTSDADATYGGAADLWGLTFTRDEIVNSGFGVVLSANITTATANVDWIRITVHYTAALRPNQKTHVKATLGV